MSEAALSGYAVALANREPSTSSALATIGRPVHAAMSGCSRLLSRVAVAWRARRDLMQLQGGDERLLRDIGLTRSEVNAAATGAWWSRRTSDFLAASSQRHASAAAGRH